MANNTGIAVLGGFTNVTTHQYAGVSWRGNSKRSVFILMGVEVSVFFPPLYLSQKPLSICQTQWTRLSSLFFRICVFCSWVCVLWWGLPGVDGKNNKKWLLVVLWGLFRFSRFMGVWRIKIQSQNRQKSKPTRRPKIKTSKKPVRTPTLCMCGRGREAGEEGVSVHQRWIFLLIFPLQLYYEPPSMYQGGRFEPFPGVLGFVFF